MIISVMAILVSCESDEMETPELEDLLRSDFSNALKVSNSEELVSILNSLDDDIAQISDLKSMWDIYMVISEGDANTQSRLMEKYPNVVKYDSDGDLELTIKDEKLARVLTPDGYIKLGKSLIKVEKNLIKSISNGDASLIQILENASESSEDGNILVEEIVEYSPAVAKGTLDYTWSGTHYSGTKKRVKWEKWGRHYPLLNYASVGGKIKYQEKKALGWFAQKRSLYLHVVCDYVGLAPHYFVEDINISGSKTAKSITVSNHYYDRGTVNPIYGLVIDFNANGIVATK